MKRKVVDEQKYYVYLHRDRDGKVFYVGKGCDDRAFHKENRSSCWNKVAKGGYTVEIFKSSLTESVAYRIENGLIAAYAEDLVNIAERVDKTVQCFERKKKIKDFEGLSKGIAETCSLHNKVVLCVSNTREAILLYAHLRRDYVRLGANPKALCRKLSLDITSNTEALKKIRKDLYKTGWKERFVWSVSLKKRGKTKKATNITVTTARKLRGAGLDGTLGEYQVLFVEDGMTFKDPRCRA